MLMDYRSTAHPATSVTPYNALMNRTVRTKLDVMIPTVDDDNYDKINTRDRIFKKKKKQEAEKRLTRKHKFRLGDCVLVKLKRINKWSTVYEPTIYKIINIE